ncbi:hypothetical protein LJR039_007272 [Pseudorhodoferax sp. LjRoot39]|uniref:hypothetical protein n=1 Tax=Pseudorhodoferax sp. LjRoot39 TaxID=3342328 RepID=UPI003ECF3CC0
MIRNGETTPLPAKLRARHVTWVPGTVQPYASLWSTVQRFIVLNKPTSGRFTDDFGVLLAKPSFARLTLEPEMVSFKRRGFWPLRFSRVLREPLPHFAFSRVGQFPRGVWELFGDRLRWCPACWLDRYHSVLFSVSELDHCPIHGIELEDRLPCSHYVAHGEFGISFKSPGRCVCGASFLDEAGASEVLPSEIRDGVMKDIADWLCCAGQKVWFRIPDPLSAVPARFTRQLTDWQRTLNLGLTPEWFRKPQILNEWKSWYHECGVAKELVPLSEPGPLRHRDASAIFKSIKRHLLRNEFKLMRQWITRFAMYSDAEYVVHNISRSEKARLAWGFLLWWQACTGTSSMREWFISRHYEDSRDQRTYPFLSTPRPPPEAITEAQVWVAGWIQVARLQFVLANALEAAKIAAIEKRAVWGRGAMGNHIAPSWSVGKSNEGKLSISIDQPHLGFGRVSRLGTSLPKP